MPSPIVDTALRDLNEHGFAVLENMIPADRAAQFAEKLQAIPDPFEPMQGYFIVRELLNVDKDFADLVVQPELLEIVQHLIGGRNQSQQNAFA